MGSMTQEEKARLDRIEEKIDKLTDAIISLARAEEKIVNLEKSVTCSLDRLVNMEEKIRSIEKKSDDAEGKLKSLSTFIWITITAGISSFIAVIFKLEP